MRKEFKLLACIVMMLFSASLFAMNFNETLSNHDASDSTGQVSGARAAKADESGSVANDEDLPDYGYVKVSSSLNVRTGPWGTIVDSLYNNNKVRIIGKEGNWYKIQHNGQVRYIHSWYVSTSPGGSTSSGGSSGGSPLVTVPAKGSVQQKLVAAAQNLVNKYKTPSSFPYDPLTKGGSLGCAQVATTALMAAGVNTGIQLGVINTLGKLRNLGWKEVRVPPYQAGDVITWKTYDSSGDGVKDNDTHIGIIMNSGNNVQAMSNSSSRKRPSLHSATYCPVCRVLRKA
ncbi:MAG: SH3 domain-containing protein [Candidatus Riflebacteria bacterium]